MDAPAGASWAGRVSLAQGYGPIAYRRARLLRRWNRPARSLIAPARASPAHDPGGALGPSVPKTPTRTAIASSGVGILSPKQGDVAISPTHFDQRRRVERCLTTQFRRPT